MDANLATTLLLALYLLPCAWQDWRTRHVSNWLTIPAFVAAWPLALWAGNFPLALAVFAGCYIAWNMKGMGAADAKLAVLVAAVAPLAIAVAGVLLAVGFVVGRVWRRAPQRLPAAVWLCAACAVAPIGLAIW